MQARIGRNEATFRRINEDIRRGRDGDDDTTLVGFVCECGKADCARLIEMTAYEYERLRADGACFAVVPGHEIPSAETLASRNARYAVVCKKEHAAVVAKATDPRR